MMTSSRQQRLGWTLYWTLLIRVSLLIAPVHVPIAFLKSTTDFSFMDEEPFPVDHAEGVMQDIPLPDPEILRWRTGAAPRSDRRKRSDSTGMLTATSQHIIRVHAASE